MLLFALSNTPSPLRAAPPGPDAPHRSTQEYVVCGVTDAVHGLSLPRCRSEFPNRPRCGAEVEQLDGRSPGSVHHATEHLNRANGRKKYTDREQVGWGGGVGCHRNLACGSTPTRDKNCTSSQHLRRKVYSRLRLKNARAKETPRVNDELLFSQESRGTAEKKGGSAA